MKAVGRRLVIRALEMVRERPRRVKQPHAETFAATVRLEDERAFSKALPRRLDEQLLAGHDNRIGRADTGLFERGVLARLADLQVERAGAIDDATAVALEPSEHCGGQLRGVAMVSRMRGGAHPI